MAERSGTGGAQGVQVWRVPLDDPPPADALQADELVRANRMLDGRVRARFVASRSWLRLLLGRGLGVAPGDVRFATGERGKPTVVDGGALEFSLSRSGDVALLALSRGQAVGVDVEVLRNGVDHAGLAHRFFSPVEAAWLREQPDDERRDAFFWLWVRKEAVTKASGAGLGDGLGHLDVLQDRVEGRWSLTSVDAGTGFAAAVAVAGTLGPVRLLAPEDLPTATSSEV